NSPDLPTTNSAFQPFLNGRFYNAFVAKFATGAPTSLKISSILPNRGGDTGTVSVIIHGDAIPPGANVKLVRGGQLDIVGNPVSVGIDGRTVTTTFDLIGKAHGLWDLTVTNLGGDTFTLPNAFTIEEGVAPKLWVDFVGRDTIRVGREQTITII